MLQASYLHGVSDVGVTIPASATPTEAQSVVDALNAQNQRIFKVTLVSTVVVGMAALINSYRVFRQLQREEIRENALMRKLAKR